MNHISSKQNRLLVETRKVRDRKHPELFFVEGKRLFDELLRSELEIENVFFLEHGFPLEDQILQRVPDNAIYSCSENAFRSICDTKNPQGIAATVRRPLKSSLGEAFTENTNGRILLLENISNPGNLGAVIRTSEAAGVKNLILTGNSTDPFNGAAVRASMGSLFRVKVFSERETESVLSLAKECHYQVFGAAAGADTSLFEIVWNEKSLICIGNEAHGLSESTIEMIDSTFRIPMESPVESLNLAVAAGVILYESRPPRAI